MELLKYFLFIFACATYVYGVPLVTKCKAGDSKCTKESAQAAVKLFADGYPAFNMEPLDPLMIKKTDASSPNLKLIVTDYTVKGLKDCVFKKAKFDKSKSRIQMKLQCSVQLDGTYDMKGQLLILPMEGNGPTHVTLRKAEFSVELNLEEIEKEGKKYWNIKDSKHSFELKDKSDVVFENLFGGNEVLGKAAREVIEESGNEIIQEVGYPVIDDTIKAINQRINEFFHHVPIDELTFDD